MEAWPAADSGAEGVDLVLIPSIEQLPDAFISFVVSVDMFTPDGAAIARVATRSWYFREVDPTESASSADPARIGQVRLKEALAALTTSAIASIELIQWAQDAGLEWRWPGAAQDAPEHRDAGGIAIVERTKHWGFGTTAETEALGAALARLDPKLSLVRGSDIIDMLYPWLSVAHSDNASLIGWLRHPAVVKRAASGGVRYLVVARVLRASTEQHGGIAPLGGPGGAGLFGLIWWSRREVADLYVLDLVAADDTRPVTHGRDVPTFALPAFIVPVPIPLLATGDSMAEALARQLLPLVRPRP